MQFSKEFEDKIVNSNGDIGKHWLESIEPTLMKYKDIFKLKKIKLFPNLTTNVIFNAYSDIYGEVIIKLEFSSRTFLNEISFINNCKSKYMVNCYYYNLEDKTMILENIKPWLPLNSVNDRLNRIKIFWNIMNDTLIDSVDEKIYRDYFNSFLNKVNDSNIINNANDDIKEKIKMALHLYDSLNELKLPKQVLHRDLHHYNILKSKDTWKVIDPQGVIGYSFFEFTQFIKSELELEKNDISKISMIVESIEKYTHCNVKLIYIALYIDTVEKILYFISIKANEGTIKYNIKICNEVLKYIK